VPIQRISVIDSHTGGEPTRVVVEGMAGLGPGTVAEKAHVFGEQFDHWRKAIVLEPRGSEVIVGALLTEPSDSTCSAGVIFFNNVGLLGMCGHGTIGLVVTLAYLGRIGVGESRIETPVGIVKATLNQDGSVSVANVPSYRKAANVEIDVPGLGLICGDIAWGGNWFFLVRSGYDGALESSRLVELTEAANRIRAAVNRSGFPEIDHIELFGPAGSGDADSRNFVLCPGGAVDRSPSGTGTSANRACLASEGTLKEGEDWRQESIIGSVFRARYQWVDQEKGIVEPTITGTAFVTAEATLLLDSSDPFCWGIKTSR
jgi:4-hydroxyproline epimerase